MWICYGKRKKRKGRKGKENENFLLEDRSEFDVKNGYFSMRK